jgi:putative Ca2+/H+ antiporter (TMEM165/GDT1 family)
MFRRLSLLFVLAVATAAAPETADEWFQELDSNHDGNIDKPEFTSGYDSLQSSSTGGGSWWTSISSKVSPKTEETTGKEDKFWKAFSSSLAMILATEIGDKTFFIAAVLSMKHDRSAVFVGAITALIIMTILSTAMGLILPNIMPRQYTHLLGALLFLYFGFKLLSEGRAMPAGKASDELEEVEEELLLQSNKKADDDTAAVSNNDDEEQQQKAKASTRKRRRRLRPLSWYQVAIQALSLTFVAEWGDRSQIATIALAASHNPLGVTIGGCLGHSFCTGLAVLGGRMLAARISEKTVHLAGGIVFLLFGLHSLFLEE